MRKSSQSNGFELVEVMIILAILAILAAILIPSYFQYRIHEREKMMKSDLQTIKAGLEKYESENGKFIPCPATPQDIPSNNSIAWSGDEAWEAIVFRPKNVFFQYEVVVDDNTYTIYARADLDRDDKIAEWTLTADMDEPQAVPKGEH